MPDYGESPDLIEMRARLAATRPKPKRAILRRRREARETRDAFRELFYPDGAHLTRAAAIVLDDLAQAAGFGAAASLTDHAELCILEGKRRLMLHLLAQLRLPAEHLEDDVEKKR